MQSPHENGHANADGPRAPLCEGSGVIWLMFLTRTPLAPLSFSWEGDHGGRVENTSSFMFPYTIVIKHACLFNGTFVPKNYIHTFICTYSFTKMLHVMRVYNMYMMYPMEGRHGGMH